MDNYLHKFFKSLGFFNFHITKLIPSSPLDIYYNEMRYPTSEEFLLLNEKYGSDIGCKFDGDELIQYFLSFLEYYQLPDNSNKEINQYMIQLTSENVEQIIKICPKYSDAILFLLYIIKLTNY